MLTFFRNWTLPIAMILGVVIYFCFAKLDFLDSTKPFVYEFVRIIMPLQIFTQLLLTFCKINFEEMRFSRYHFYLLFVQLFFVLILSAIVLSLPLNLSMKYALEGAIVCFIAPTATAAAVITNKLGGSVARTTMYTILMNLIVAFLVPLLFPLLEPSEMSFFSAFFRIAKGLIPTMILPLFLAYFFKKYFPAIHQFLASYSFLSFYLWAFTLVILMAQTTQAMIHSDLLANLGGIIVAFFACCIQFSLGKWIGQCYNDRITAGQSLGQKNTVLAIWMANVYLNPTIAIAPGAYVVWQNIFNSYQLYRVRVGKSI